MFNKHDNLVVILTLLVLCKGEYNCSQAPQPTDDEKGVCLRDSSSFQFYDLADKSQAAYTGTISTVSHIFTEERSNLCPDAGHLVFRTINGTCNHARNRGASFTIQDRFLPSAYADGVNTPRHYGEDGSVLPSARNVSMRIHKSRDGYSNYTLAVMAWGQWVDHDMVSTPVTSRPDNPIRCCGPNGTYPSAPLHPDCYPVRLPKDDDNFRGECLEFVRSLAATYPNGTRMSPRRQINSVTAFMDGSHVYGSTDEVAESIREKGGYRLLTKNGYYLPESNSSGCIKRNESNDYCFLTGDLRANQHPYLGALHTLWMREHNRLANQLRILKPDVSNEEIYQRARRIVIACLQAITFNRWLPLYLGTSAFQSKLVSNYGRSSYNPKLDPTTMSEFSAAAFRTGHSSIPSYYIIGKRRILLRDLFNRVAEVLDNYNDVLLGMSGITNRYPRYIQTIDKFFVPDVAKFLFQNKQTGFGLDLVTINIQRGREQGLQPYYKYRVFCGLPPIRGFDDVNALGPHGIELAKVFKSVKDIDLFTGITHEPVRDGLVGPTAKCILLEQFTRAKYGDRYFYNNNEEKSRFTDPQLAALNRVELSHIICLNSDIEYITTDVFRPVSEYNPLVPCARLRRKSLNPYLFV